MTRRTALLTAPLSGLPVAAAAAHGEDPAAATGGPLRAVFHVNLADTGRLGHGLKNIENVLRELGDGGAVIEVVYHDGGIGLVERARSEQMAALIWRSVRFVACRNTKTQKLIRPEDLIAGVTIVPSCAVAVIRRQHEGFAYFRP